MLDSILDLNTNNVWSLNEYEIGKLWEKDRKEEDFSTSEDKLLNIIRLAFEVVHYNAEDERDVNRFENGDWVKLVHCNAQKGVAAIRRKTISRISDLSYENIKHISASTLLELIDRNFGGGWDSLSLAMRDIIETGFDISTTQLPASRIHSPGGTVEKKVAQGYDVLEITKGTWIEAIFAKKKDPVVKLRFDAPDVKDDDDENLLEGEDDVDMKDEEDEEDGGQDDTFYSSYAPEAAVKNDGEEEEDDFSEE